MTAIPRRVLLALLRGYQVLLSPWLGGSCRYWPTCSEYAREAIERHGVLAGCWLAARRLARCHPWGAGGFDPVPEYLRGHVASDDSVRTKRDL